ncbi:MAG: hemerythrin domain-containing protein [Novosphingobium sp.]
MSELRSRTGTLVLAGAAGLTAGLLANFVRKGAVQAPSILAGRWDDALAAEHRAALALIEKIERTDERQTTRRTVLFTQLKHALGKHAFQEENSIYAMLRLRGLAEPAVTLNEDHGEVKRLLYELTQQDNSDPSWLDTVRALRAALEPHMRAEELDVFPRLRHELSDEENRRLTVAMHKEGLKLA